MRKGRDCVKMDALPKLDSVLNDEYQGMTVFQMLERATEKFQEQELFSYWYEGHIVTINYLEFFRDVRRLGAYFDSLGLRGRRIVIDGRNTYEQYMTFFAAMSIGAVAAPLCFDLEMGDLRQLIERLDPALIVYDEEDEEILPDIRGNDVPVMACMGEKGVRGILDGDGPLYQDNGLTTIEQPALILATSGSTGRPKLVVHSQSMMIPREDKIVWREICVISMYHVGVERMMIDIARGIPCCISSFRQAAFDIQWYRPEELFAVPSFIDLLIKRDSMGTLDLGCFRMCTSVGATQTLAMEEYLNRRGIFCGSAYGTTETRGAVTYFQPGEYRAGSAGKVAPWNEVRISDRGEILVRNDIHMLGYLDDPESTAEVLVDGWYHTGDVGYIDEDGFLYITGRIKNIIVLSNGENVSPEAVEKKLSVCDDIEEVIVAEEDHQIAARIWCGEHRDQNQEDRVRAFVAAYNKRVPSFQAIRNIVFREEPFPKTISGKIKR